MFTPPKMEMIKGTHLTNPMSAVLIEREGFRISACEGFGDYWGNAVYLALDDQTIDFYHGIAKEPQVALQVQAKVAPLHVEVNHDYEEYHDLVADTLCETLAAQLTADIGVDETTAWDLACQEYLQRKWILEDDYEGFLGPQGSWFDNVYTLVKSFGYTALIITDKTGESLGYSGGNQLVALYPSSLEVRVPQA